MTEYRKPTPAEIEALTAAGNSAENWDAIEVAQNFTPAQLSGCRLEGRVQIGRGARLRRCTIRNYRIGEEALIEGVTALECRRESSFGNGVRVAAINENGGRTVRIYDRLTAQTAYILAVYRYRPEAVEAIERMIERYASERRDTLGTVGPHARITGARFIREVNIGEGATIDGRSAPELMSASTSRPAISSPQKEPASTAARFSNAASPANAARWTNTSRPSIRSFSPTATAKTERPFRSSRVPTPFRTTNPRC